MTGETLNVTVDPVPRFKEILLLLLLTMFFCGREASIMNFDESNFLREAGVRKSLRRESSTNAGSVVFRLKRKDHSHVVSNQHLLSKQAVLHTALKRDRTRLKVLYARLNKYLASNGNSQHPLDIKSEIKTKSFNTLKFPTTEESLQSPVEVGNGIYYTEVELGTPPKKFTLTMDTGSDLCWVQCEPCAKCYDQKGPKFNPKQSSSYKKLSCSNPLCQSVSDKCAADESCLYSYGYGDGSTTKGNLSTETIRLYKADGTTRAIEGFAFGCGNANQGTFDSTEEGTLGLGNGFLSLLSQLGPKHGNKFSYCLVRQAADESSCKTSPLIIGDGAVPTEPGLQYTTMTPRSSFYFVDLEDVSVGSKRLNLPAGTFNANDKGDSATIFDSGTTFTYLPENAYDAIEKAFLSSTSLFRVQSREPDLGLCFQMGGSASLVPSLTFHFKGGASYPMPLENYFVPLGNAGVFCLAITSTRDSIYTLGNIQQQNFHILYDRENSRLGFVSTDCSTLG